MYRYRLSYSLTASEFPWSDELKYVNYLNAASRYKEKILKENRYIYTTRGSYDKNLRVNLSELLHSER